MAEQAEIPTVMDEVEELERIALTLRTLGWMLLVFDGIVAVWIWMGLKSGSALWLWWTGLEGIAGVLLLGMASYYQMRASRTLAAAADPAAVERMRREPPPDEAQEHKAA